jgi:hypothetical protein
LKTAVFVALLLASTLTAAPMAIGAPISESKIAPAKRLSIVHPSPKHPSQLRTAASKPASVSAKDVGSEKRAERTSESSENGSNWRASIVGLSPGYTLRPHIPLPEPELLMRQAAPDCEFRSAAQSTDQAALHTMRLDYERQCYRQSEFIVRARMERLQEAVMKTIESLNGGDETSGQRSP